MKNRRVFISLVVTASLAVFIAWIARSGCFSTIMTSVMPNNPAAFAGFKS